MRDRDGNIDINFPLQDSSDSGDSHVFTAPVSQTRGRNDNDNDVDQGLPYEDSLNIGNDEIFTTPIPAQGGFSEDVDTPYPSSQSDGGVMFDDDQPGVRTATSGNIEIKHFDPSTITKGGAEDWGSMEVPTGSRHKELSRERASKEQLHQQQDDAMLGSVLQDIIAENLPGASVFGKDNSEDEDFSESD